MKNRLQQTFEKTKDIAFMPFVLAGYPTLDASIEIAMAAAKYADVIELSLPYSDPLADGPVIQQANQVALMNGMNTVKFFDMIKKIRLRKVTTPIVIMTYCNLVHAFGVERFYEEAKNVGADAVLIPDLPVEESERYQVAARRYGIALVFLVSLMTGKDRLREIQSRGPAFIYLVSVLGTTGARSKVSEECLDYLRGNAFTVPVCVGFGISNIEQVKGLRSAGADGYIVGSSLIGFIGDNFSKKDFYQLFDKHLSEITKRPSAQGS